MNLSYPNLTYPNLCQPNIKHKFEKVEKRALVRVTMCDGGGELHHAFASSATQVPAMAWNMILNIVIILYFLEFFFFIFSQCTSLHVSVGHICFYFVLLIYHKRKG